MLISLLIALVSVAVAYPAGPVTNEFYPNTSITLFDNTATGTLTPTIDFLALSQQVFNAYVRARTNPLGFAQELAPIDLAASYLAGNATKVGTLTYNGYLRKAANLLIADQSVTGQIGHIGGDGSTPGKRISTFGTWLVAAGENIAYGPSNHLNIMAMFIRSPGHYANVYRSSYTLLGVSCGSHPVYRISCVCDFTGGFIPF